MDRPELLGAIRLSQECCMPKTKRCWLRFSRAALVASLALLLPGILTVAAVSIHSDANMIVQRLVKVLKQDWQAAPKYDCFERHLEHQEFWTYRVMMILGSPYRRLGDGRRHPAFARRLPKGAAEVGKRHRAALRRIEATDGAANSGI